MNANGLYYVRLIWAHSFPNDPVVILYEVTQKDNCVIRMIDLFADGRLIREKLGDDPHARPDSPCLWDGLFEFPIRKPLADTFSFITSSIEFNTAYAKAQVKTFDLPKTKDFD